MLQLLQDCITSWHVSVVHFVLQGVDKAAATSMVEHYHQMKALVAHTKCNPTLSGRSHNHECHLH